MTAEKVRPTDFSSCLELPELYNIFALAFGYR